MLIMEYANNGNLRGCLTEITSNWYQKLFILYKIIVGLGQIHKENLIHYNFHDGNILCNKYGDSKYVVFISNYLESLQLAKSFLKKDNIYGIIPFIAPEVLEGKPYTQASNIYSFSIIMWELTSRIPPFNNRAHDMQLALSICKGERPEIIENTPQCYIDLMKKCWDEDPLKRPSASEILDIIKKWIFQPSGMKIKNINEGLKNNIMEFINAPIEHNNPITEFHPQTYYKGCLLNFTSKELNEKLKFFELKQKQKDTEQKLPNLEMVAETYYKSSQLELRIKQKELVNLQQQNFQLEQNCQNLTEQIREFVEKENTLQVQITYLQNEKQALADDLAKQLEQNKLINQQTIQLEQEKNNLQDQLVNLQQQNFQLEQNCQTSTEQIRVFAEKENTLQAQITYLQNEKQALANDLAKQLEQNKLTSNQKISQLEQEKNNLQDQLFQAKTELKSQQERLIEQKEQLKNKVNQFQQQIEEGKIFKDSMLKALLQAQELTNKEKDEKAELKAKLEKEIAQLEQKLINEGQIKEQLTHVLQLKDKINELEKKLVILDQECIKQPGKGILASYIINKKKKVLNQVNKFLKAKGDFLTLREETIKKLQKQYEVINDRIAIGIIEEVVSETKKFQDILVECNEVGLFQMDEDHNSLMNIIQENKELEVSLKINDILKVDSFDLNKYKIITIATNSWEGTRTHLDSDMMAEDIKSLKKNLGELISELRQQKKELKNLVD
jgi:serine/threonine protein kinase